MLTSQTLLKRKIAQLFIVAVPLIKEEKELFKTIKEYINLGVGGLIIGVGGKWDFIQTNNVTDIKKLKKFISGLKKLDPSLFLAVDGEGGNEFNLFENIASLKSARKYGLQFEQTGDTKQFERDFNDFVAILKECKINMNFAPVLDIAQGGYTGYTGENGRSYSDKDHIIKTLGGIAIEKTQKNKIIAVAKHFPSYGYIDKDPHKYLESLKNYKDNNNLVFSPFSHAIKNHSIQGIMKGHVISHLDKELPATLSIKVEKYLRKKLKFNGLSVTDQIFMKSLNEYYKKKGSNDIEGKKRIVDAAKCNDILLVTYPTVRFLDGGDMVADSHDHFQRLHSAVYNAVIKGDIPKNKINESYKRIIHHKKLLGIK